ncbi:MAG TPA: hypothetical protein VGM09_25215 [Bradyrhizobium sp.]|jgi:hypothetical protein
MDDRSDEADYAGALAADLVERGQPQPVVTPPDYLHWLPTDQGLLVITEHGRRLIPPAAAPAFCEGCLQRMVHPGFRQPHGGNC